MSAAPAVEPRPRPDTATAVLLTGIAVLGVGMAAVLAGVVAAPLFLPGVVAVGLGLLGIAAGAAARTWTGSPDEAD